MTTLRARRISRWVVERCAGGGLGARVAGLHRRVVNLRIGDAEFVTLAAAEIPLSASGVAADMGPDATFADFGVRPGQTATLGAGALRLADAGLEVRLGAAARWEPRPAIGTVSSRELCSRARMVRALAIADGAGRSLLPLLWARGGVLESHEPARSAAAPAAALGGSAASNDARGVESAARRLAGLGPGLTPSGDDYLAGFAAAWTLGCRSLGRSPERREAVLAAVQAGARSRATDLGRAWLAHAARGEVAEPMARFFRACLGVEPVALAPAARAVLALGSTSGTDWMTGALAGIDAALAAGGGELAWN